MYKLFGQQSEPMNCDNKKIITQLNFVSTLRQLYAVECEPKIEWGTMDVYNNGGWAKETHRKNVIQKQTHTSCESMKKIIDKEFAKLNDMLHNKN